MSVEGAVLDESVVEHDVWWHNVMIEAIRKIFGDGARYWLYPGIPIQVEDRLLRDHPGSIVVEDPDFGDGVDRYLKLSQPRCQAP